jgi:hypothetical protein
VNPPFSKLEPFALKFSQEVDEGVFLGSYSIEAKWSRHLNGSCYLLVPHRRLRFEAPPGVEDPKSPYPTTVWVKTHHSPDMIRHHWKQMVGTGVSIFRRV